MARTLPGDTSSKKKKKTYKPVTVKATSSARQSGIPVQRAVTEINKAAGRKVVRTTKSRKKADVLVRAMRSPTRKQEGTTGRASRVPKSRAAIEHGKTTVSVTPNAPRVYKKYAKSQNPPVKTGKGRRRTTYKTRSTVHELGHALGLPDRYFNKRTTKSVMDTGATITGYDVKRIKETVGLKKPAPRRRGSQR